MSAPLARSWSYKLWRPSGSPHFYDTQQITQDQREGIRTWQAENTTLNDLFDVFMKARSDLRESTRFTYTYLYEGHVRDAIGRCPVSKVHHKDIQSYYCSLVHDHRLKANTIGTIHAILCQLCQMAIVEQMIRSNPTDGAMKVVSREPSAKGQRRRALTEAEQDSLTRFLRDTPEFRRYYAFFVFLLGTGLRIGEAGALQWSDCDFEKGLIHVSRSIAYRPEAGVDEHHTRYVISSTKTECGTRTVPMFSAVRGALLEERARQREQGDLAPRFEVDGCSDFVFLTDFGKPYASCNAGKLCAMVISHHNAREEEEALASGRQPVLLPHFTPHVLRHTFCTRLCAHEPRVKVVQEIMGHSNSAVTLDVYAEATQAQKSDLVRALDCVVQIGARPT